MAGAVIVGAGPGIGLSVARRCAREGLPVGVIARSRSTVDALLAEVEGPGASATADVTDAAALRHALDAVVAEHGVPDLLVYNAGLIRTDVLGELTTAELQQTWAVNVLGAVTTAAHVLPRMVENGGGTYLLTGGMPNVVPDLVSLSLGKAGLRALTELLAKQFGPDGVHVATVTVAGEVAPGGDHDPDDIADRYWALHRQPPDQWQHEVVHGPVTT